MEIIGRNAMNIVLMSSCDGPVAIVDIISKSEMRIIFTYHVIPAIHCLVSFQNFHLLNIKVLLCKMLGVDVSHRCFVIS